MLGLVLGLVIVGGILLGIAGDLFHAEKNSHIPNTLYPLPIQMAYLDAKDITRRGSPNVLMLTVDGGIYGSIDGKKKSGKGIVFVPHHFRHEGLAAPLTISQWAAHLGAKVVFNAGQFDAQLDYLGWLKSEGDWISKRRQGTWQGLLLSAPVDRAAWGRIADLSQASPDVIKRYKHVVQSMMLLDDTGKLRVRESTKSACRTVIAEDQLGRILIFFTMGAVTLADFGRWLQKQPLNIVRAMNLDGGIESQLAIRTEDFRYDHYGRFGARAGAQGRVVEAAAATVGYPLPVVIEIQARP